jgi:hypothetical protein
MVMEIQYADALSNPEVFQSVGWVGGAPGM